MQNVIKKERIHLMSPCANVCAIMSFEGAPSHDEMQHAINIAVERNRILRCRVVLENDGSAFLEECVPPVGIELQEFDCGCDAGAFALEQEQLPFRLDEGEVIRFFRRSDGNHSELVVVTHHLVCDGGSLVILAGDILSALNGADVAEKPVRLLEASDLPKHHGLNFAMRLMLRGTNSQWRKTGRAFGFEDYRRLAASYHSNHRTALYRDELSGEQLERLKKYAHDGGFSINSLIAAAFASVVPAGSGVGVAVDVRPADINGMGNFSTGISVASEYSPEKTLSENAAHIHHQIRQKLDSPKNKFFLYDFMNAISPSLIDAIYFVRYDNYRNQLAEGICRMCGYTGEPDGISTSNLRTVELPDSPAWRYRCDVFWFIPPYIPNVRAVAGISTYRDKMTVTLHTADDDYADYERRQFEKACALLKSAAE